ncbi:hypothetical protein PMAG_a2437 [Pseudoalteromonas mariniglutinosa NCIMB 1770]|nr:hypothetical protein [Pseudoalteromonas mariniglutinosa NCIMB 1770]
MSPCKKTNKPLLYIKTVINQGEGIIHQANWQEKSWLLLLNML